MPKKSQKIKTVSDWLQYARKRLSHSGFNSSSLDSELILATVLKTNRQTLHAHPERNLSPTIIRQANRLLRMRLKDFPIAYMTGTKEFFGHDFIVSRDVLIPRQESEDMIELALNSLPSQNTINILDVGCGSGVLGQSLAIELSRLGINFKLTQSDISPKALKIASKNAKKHNLNVQFIKSNLLAKTGSSFDIILANLPYVNKKWHYVDGVKFEPKIAIFAPDNGLSLIKKFIHQIAEEKTNYSRMFLLESDMSQTKEIQQMLKNIGARGIASSGYITLFHL